MEKSVSVPKQLAVAALLTTSISLLHLGGAIAQSSLPRCSADVSVFWTACIGSRTSPDGNNYEGEYIDGVPNGRGTLMIPNYAIYVGEFKDGKPNGQGRITSKDGHSYVGEFKDGVPDGKGVSKLPDGTLYVGQAKNGKFYHTGTKTLSDGSKYQGDLEENKMHGHGIVALSDGRRFDGEFRDGQQLGKGTLTYPDGRLDDGDFENFALNGRGTQTTKEGFKYTGEFHDGSRHGRGIAEFTPDNKDGQASAKSALSWSYDGEWKDDKIHGRGKFTDEEGDVFEGEFRENQQTGQGQKISKNGDIQEGQFSNLKLNGEGSYIKKDGQKYVGFFRDGKKHGAGTLFNVNGFKAQGNWVADDLEGQGSASWRAAVGNTWSNVHYEGQFKAGRFSGTGTMVVDSGYKYVGEWRDGKRHGWGTETLPDGSIYSGEFRDNNRVTPVDVPQQRPQVQAQPSSRQNESSSVLAQNNTTPPVSSAANNKLQILNQSYLVKSDLEYLQKIKARNSYQHKILFCRSEASNSFVLDGGSYETWVELHSAADPNFASGQDFIVSLYVLRNGRISLGSSVEHMATSVVMADNNEIFANGTSIAKQIIFAVEGSGSSDYTRSNTKNKIDAFEIRDEYLQYFRATNPADTFYVERIALKIDRTSLALSIESRPTGNPDWFPLFRRLRCELSGGDINSKSQYLKKQIENEKIKYIEAIQATKGAIERRENEMRARRKL